MREAVRREGAVWAEGRLQTLGRELGSEEVLQLGSEANENPPRLKTHNRQGQRVDQVDFHPAYHRLMTIAKENGIHSLGWTANRPGGQVARAAMMYMMGQVESGVCCPISMTHAGLAVLTNLLARFIQRELAGIPLNILFQYIVPIAAIPLLIAFKYGSQAFNGAAPEGWPAYSARPEEAWADCFAQATTGIVRVDGDRDSWTMNNNYTLKSLSYWPAEQYFNIWVCNLTSHLGYAQFPVSDLEGLENSSTNRLTDGIVIHYKAFGSIDDGPFSSTSHHHRFVGSTATSAPDESGVIPGGAAYVLTQLWSGADVPFTLTALDAG